MYYVGGTMIHYQKFSSLKISTTFLCKKKNYSTRFKCSMLLNFKNLKRVKAMSLKVKKIKILQSLFLSKKNYMLQKKTFYQEWRTRQFWWDRFRIFLWLRRNISMISNTIYQWWQFFSSSNFWCQEFLRNFWWIIFHDVIQQCLEHSWNKMQW